MKGLVIAITTAAMLVAACGERNGKPDPSRPRLDNGRVVFPDGSPQLAALQIDVVKPGMPEQLRLTGRLVWDEERTVRLFPPFAGRVTQIIVKPGDPVKPGEPLAFLSSPDFGQAQMEARRAQSDFSLAQKNLERLRELHAAGVAARKDLNAAEADYARAEAELARATSRVKVYGSGDAVDQNFALRSPIAGTVVERNINPGQELRPDLASANVPAMFVVTDPSRLWVQLDATERDLGRVRPGMQVKLKTSAWPDEIFGAKIVTVADFIDPATRTVKVRGAVENRDRKLKGEMFVSADIEGPPRAKLQVPEKAIVQADGKNYVFVEEAPGRYARAEVRLDGVRDGVAGILAGLDLGQKVVVEGNLFLNRLFRQLSGDAST